MTAATCDSLHLLAMVSSPPTISDLLPLSSLASCSYIRICWKLAMVTGLRVVREGTELDYRIFRGRHKFGFTADYTNLQECLNALRFGPSNHPAATGSPAIKLPRKPNSKPIMKLFLAALMALSGGMIFFCLGPRSRCWPLPLPSGSQLLSPRRAQLLQTGLPSSLSPRMRSTGDLPRLLPSTYVRARHLFDLPPALRQLLPLG